MGTFGTQPLASPVLSLDFKEIIVHAHSLAQEESKASESTSVPDWELEKIIAYVQSFTQEENNSGKHTLIPNTEMDKIIGIQQTNESQQSRR